MDPRSSRPSIAFGHVCLTVSDVAASARFYEALGCHAVHDSEAMAILELRGGTHLMLFAGEPADRAQPGFDLMVDDVQAFRARLVAARIECGELARHEPSGHLHFTCADPDGYQLVVYSDHTDGRRV